MLCLKIVQEVAREEERSAAAVASFQRRQQEMATLKEQIQTLQERCATLEEELTVAKQRESDTGGDAVPQPGDSDVDNHDASTTARSPSASAAEQEVLALSERVSSLEEQLATATSSVGDLQNELAAAKEACSRLSAVQGEKDSLAEKLRKEATDAQELVKSLERECLLLQDRKADVQAELEESRELNGELTSTNASLCTNLETLRQEHQKERELQSKEWNELLAEKNNRIEQLQQQSEEAIGTESSAQTLLASRERELETVTKDLRSAREVADDLERQFRTADALASERGQEVCCHCCARRVTQSDIATVTHRDPF